MEQRSAFRGSTRPQTAQYQQQPPQGSDVVRVQGGRLYVVVRRRLQEFRKDHPGWRILTQLVESTPDMATFRAEVRDENDNLVSTGHDRAHGENCVALAETGAIGRAISLIGYGSDDVLERIEDEE